MTQLAKKLVVVAPDSFKGTFTSAEVTALVSAGLRSSGFAVAALPLADGGEGTLEVLRAVYGGNTQSLVVMGPLGEETTATYLVSTDGRTAVVETAAASGLALVDPDPSTAWSATTYGTGQLIAAASQQGVDRILVGVGGSATTDGGAGAVAAISEAGGLGNCRVHVLCDVQTPFERAAKVFAPQKGADPATVRRLTSRLEAAAAVMTRDPRGHPMTGAAGGLSGGLWAEVGADLCSGIDFVLRATDFAAVTRGAVAVVTGEGSLDAQTASGKVIAGVLASAAETQTPVHAIVGRSELDRPGWEALGLASVTTASTSKELAKVGSWLAFTIGS